MNIFVKGFYLGLEIGLEAKAKTLEAEARTLEAEAEARTLEAEAEAEAGHFGLEAEARPRGLTSLMTVIIIIIISIICLSDAIFEEYPNRFRFWIPHSEAPAGVHTGIISPTCR